MSMFNFFGITLLVAIISYFIYKNNAFNTQNAYFQAVLDNVPVLMYLKDTSGRIIKVNKAFTDILKCSRKELEGKHSSELFLSKYKDLITEEDKVIVNEQKSIFIDRCIEIIEGEPHWYNILKTPIYDKNQKLIGIFVSCKNIDFEKDIAKKKECFVANLTHDLKSPVISQLNSLTMLLNGSFGKLNPGQHEMIDLIRCSCDYLFKLINTIMDTYIYDNGKIKLSPTEFDISKMIEKLSYGLNQTLVDKKLKIVVNNELSDNMITADRLQLKRVIMNLVTNATNYSLQNSEIQINMKSDGENLEFNVINQSKFAPTENFDTVFEKYKTLGNSKYNKTSTGLGLYLSKQIIELHNGEIYAKILPENKCLFGFTIPAKIRVLS